MSEELAGLEQAFQKNLPTDLRETWCFPTSEWPRIYSVIFDAAWKVATDLAYQLSVERTRADEAEKALALIGERAVVDWDDRTVGAVDAVVKDPQRYGEWLRETLAKAHRSEAMAARVAMLENAARTALYAVEALKLPCPMDPEHPQSRRNGAYASIALNLHQTLMSTPSADLEAHDAKVREPLERRIEELNSKVAAMGVRAKLCYRWLETNQPDVFSRGLYAALGHTHKSFKSLEREEAAAHDARIRREEREAAVVKVDELAALVRLLVHSIRKHSPDNETARKAMDYLRRHELQGSPLRTTILSPAPDAAKPNNQQEQP